MTFESNCRACSARPAVTAAMPRLSKTSRSDFVCHRQPICAISTEASDPGSKLVASLRIYPDAAALSRETAKPVTLAT